jgi:hypothetical protein
MDGVNQLTERIIGVAIAVHRELGPGLLESAYEECMAMALHDERMSFDRQGDPLRVFGLSSSDLRVSVPPVRSLSEPPHDHH